MVVPLHSNEARQRDLKPNPKAEKGNSSISETCTDGKDTLPLLLRTSPTGEKAKYAIGMIILGIAGPYVAVQIGMCTLWEFLDKKTFNLIKFCQWINTKTSPHCKKFVKNEKDAFMVNEALILGLLLPAYFLYELYLATTVGVSYMRIFMYNLIRIGPMYMNFMYVYVLCHKEAHLRGQMWNKKYRFCKLFPIRFIFNYWVGNFHGVIPGNFTVCHIYNHHWHDNSDLDVITTAFRPRNDVHSFIPYVTDWFLYTSNISTFYAMLVEKKHKLVIETAVSSLYYITFFLVIFYINPTFALLTVLYPYLEGSILIAIINFVWHAFIDPEEPHNDYITSTTIIDGMNFTLSEEYHVVHHQYPGAHWTKHKKLYQKHLDGYRRRVPSVFEKLNIFEMFGYMLSKDYDKLVEAYHKPFQGDLSDEELKEILKTRLEHSGLDVAIRLRERDVHNVRQF